MRILLEESVPARLGALLVGHWTTTVQRHGWAGLKNGKLLAAASREFDVLLTADRGIEHQQNLDELPIAVLIVRARSNRIDDMKPLVAQLLDAHDTIGPQTLRTVPD